MNMKESLTSAAISALILLLTDVSYGQDVETRNYSDGSFYVGEFRDGQRNGQGTYTYASGDVYVGEFKDDERNGQGTLTFGPGDFEGIIYVGRWMDGEYIGQ